MSVDIHVIRVGFRKPANHTRKQDPEKLDQTVHNVLVDERAFPQQHGLAMKNVLERWDVDGWRSDHLEQVVV